MMTLPHAAGRRGGAAIYGIAAQAANLSSAVPIAADRRAGHAGVSPPAAAAAAAVEIEELISQDEGGRGMAALVLRGELMRAVGALSRSKHVGVVTGFPCLIDEGGSVREGLATPQETDGPPGAVAIAKAVLGQAADTSVTVFTDEVNAGVVQSCIDAHGLAGGWEHHGGRVPSLRCFPAAATRPAADWHTSWADVLRQPGGLDCLVAIERAGPAADGRYYTMGAKDMTHLLAPLDQLFVFAAAYGQLERPLTGGTIGIGDGGNELGMGKVIGAVHEHIRRGTKIGCVVPSDVLVACSVSNWGGYALGAALAALRIAENNAAAVSAIGDTFSNRSNDTHRVEAAEAVLEAMMISEAEGRACLEGALAAGARDGIAGTVKPEMVVDGMAWCVRCHG
eukprot:COSAG05_NODE_157_length_15666_cov_29.830410_16_plen_395_part_00